MNNSTNSLESPTSTTQEGPLEEHLFSGNRRSMLQSSPDLRVDDWPTVDELSLASELADRPHEHWIRFNIIHIMRFFQALALALFQRLVF